VVSIEPYEAYRQTIQAELPHARIACEHFHPVRGANSVDSIRRERQRQHGGAALACTRAYRHPAAHGRMDEGRQRAGRLHNPSGRYGFRGEAITRSEAQRDPGESAGSVEDQRWR
jgi:transposase